MRKSTEKFKYQKKNIGKQYTNSTLGQYLRNNSQKILKTYISRTRILTEDSV